MPRPIRGKSAAGVVEQQKPPLRIRQSRTGRPQPSGSEMLKLQQIPNPLLPPQPSRQNPPLQTPPLPLPDYEYYDNNPDEPDDNEIIAYGSDNDVGTGQEAETERRERLRRIHTHALRYLAGERIYIHSARLRGPVVDNPWKRKPPEAGDMVERPGTTGEIERPLKKRKVWEHDDREIIATPTQNRDFAPPASIEADTIAKAPPKKRATTKAKAKAIIEGDTIVVSPRPPVTTTKGTKAAAKRVIRKKPTTARKIKQKPVLPLDQESEDNQLRAGPTARKRIRKATTQKEPEREEAEVGKEKEKEVEQAPIISDTIAVGRAVEHLPEKTPERETPAPITTNHTAERSTSEPLQAARLQLDKRMAMSESPLEDHAEININESATPPSQNRPQYQKNVPTIGAPTTSGLLLSMAEATPPSVFYGTKNTKNSKATSSKLAANRRVESEPVKKVAGESTTAPGSQRKRAVSAPVPLKKISATKEKSKKPSGKKGKATIPIEKQDRTAKKRKADALEGTEAELGHADGNGDEWIPISTGFMFKKVAKKSASATTTTADEDKGLKRPSKERSKGKGKGKAKEKGNEIEAAGQKPKPKRAKVVDFAALSPFGGGQVVTKDGKAYSSPDAGKSSAIQNASDENSKKSELATTGNDNESNGSMVPAAHMAPPQPKVSTQVPASEGSPLPKISNNATSPVHGASRLSEHIADTAGVTAGPTAKSNDETETNPNSLNPKTPARLSNFRDHPTQPEKLFESLPRAAQSQPSFGHATLHDGDLSPPRPLSQQLVVLKPRVSQTEVAAHDSPFYNTQRQLSAAKRGFMSILDTPFSDKSSVFDHTSIPQPVHRAPQNTNPYHRFQVDKSNGSPFPISRIQPPETPAADVSTFDFDFNEAGQTSVDFASPSNTTIDPRLMEEPKTPIAKPKRTGVNMGLSSPFPPQHGESAASTQQSESKFQEEPTSEVGAPNFSPFKSFNTPTKSQFGNFMGGFSPLRYSPPPAASSNGQNRSMHSEYSPEKHGEFDLFVSESEQSSRPVGQESNRDADRTPSTETRKPVEKPSTWLGINRPSGISFFNSSPARSLNHPASSPPPQFHPLSPPQPGEQSPSSTLPPAQNNYFDLQPPKTPVQRSRSRGMQPGEQSPGTKLAGDMLEIMGGGIWDLDDELKKIEKSSTTKPPATASRFTGRGLFSGSGTRRFGRGTGT
ncbi:hypothetical protein DFH27DRAFT_393790 [Peziza echinospora]|nr:hypothetical protein DFH27DRAFT_393790 [Peziza echinospora]